MLVTLGFLLAALILLFILPYYRRRIERFTSEKLKRALPLTEAEIRADKDRLRAEFAIDLHKLEMKLDDANLSAARQSVEINRRDAKVHDLGRAVNSQKAVVEEHENARRVLEQAITDRLPKIEQRLSDARKLLLQRDREIVSLTDTSGKQTEALDQATQINVQLTEDVHRLQTALETRAARNRETIGDPRFDGEVALRTELEALRAQTREQAQLLERLQSVESGDTEQSRAESTAQADIERLKKDLSEAEAQLLAFKSEVGAEMSARDAQSARIRDLEQLERDRSAEIASLKAALTSYEEAARETSGAIESSAAARAELSALQAEITEQRRTIETLRAEVTSNNERLSRQAQYFRDEMRRLSTSSRPASDGRNGETETPRQSLAERIAQPRVPAAETHDGARDMRTAAYLTTVNGGGDDHPAANVGVEAVTSERPAPVIEAPRRGRLLERISSLDKQ